MNVHVHHEFTYTTTPLYVAPNNKEIDGSIPDDRRCRTAQSGTHDYGWNSSQGESEQVSHTWETNAKVADQLLGLEVGVSHSNSWSWACSTSTGTSHTAHITYTSPEGEYGYHDIEWALSGNQYDGTEVALHWCNEHTPRHLMDTVDLGSKTDKRRSRDPIVSAGEWHDWDKACLVSRDGCGEADMCCDGSDCTKSGCDHNCE